MSEHTRSVPKKGSEPVLEAGLFRTDEPPDNAFLLTNVEADSYRDRVIEAVLTLRKWRDQYGRE